MSPTTTERARTIALTTAALIGFAANSLLCRAALASASIDPATFTLVRLASGAFVLSVLARGGGPAAQRDVPRDRVMPVALFAYAIFFSYAYVRLRTGAGALLLFGAVQVTMLVSGVRRGERPAAAVFVGLLLALAGLAVLTWPTTSSATPDAIGAVLMVIAGVAWGVYSLRGRGSKEPLRTTARNFVLGAPLALVVALVFAARAHVSVRGISLAIGSGALASGVGYSLWYAALPRLTAARAAVVQLTVPVIAAVGGVIVLGEPLTTRLLVAGATILGGVAIALFARSA